MKEEAGSSALQFNKTSLNQCNNPLQYSCLENPMNGGACGLPSMGHTESDTTEATQRQTSARRQTKKRTKMLAVIDKDGEEKEPKISLD